METKYSIIYFNHKNQFDRTAVGLAFYDGNKLFIDYNKQKLKDLKKHNGYELFYSALTQICKKLKNPEQLGKLRSLYNGIIKITDERSILIECTEVNFYLLFEKCL